MVLSPETGPSPSQLNPGIEGEIQASFFSMMFWDENRDIDWGGYVVVIVQELSHVRLFAIPWTAACQASRSFTSPEVYSNSCPLSWWCHPTISSSVIPFSSCLQSFPASGSFPTRQLLASSDQSIGISASVSVLPMNVQGWFPLGWTALISLQSKGLSRVCFRSTTQKHQFFGAQHSLLSISIDIWVTAKFGVWFWLWAVVKFLWVKDNWWHLWENLWNVSLATEQTMEERKNRKEKGRELRVPGGGGQIGRWGRGWQVGEQGLSLGDSRPVQQAMNLGAVPWVPGLSKQRFHHTLPEAFLEDMDIHSLSLDDLPALSDLDTLSPSLADTPWESYKWFLEQKVFSVGKVATWMHYFRHFK